MSSIESSRCTTHTPGPETWVAVADLHGHPGHLRALLAHLDRELGEQQYRLVTLGDYLDNGPAIPELLELLLELQAARGDRFVPILGNHDLACLRALGWPGTQPDPVWCRRWAARYWNPGLGTPQAYGAADALELAAQLPPPHRRFLEALPWYHDTGRFFFVHAGLEPGPIARQRATLEARRLPAEHEHLPPPIREKRLAAVSDPTWDRIVVSAHTQDPNRGRTLAPHAPHYVTERRICLSAEVDATGRLHAVILPAVDGAGSHPQSTGWRFLEVSGEGKVGELRAGGPEAG